MLEHDVTEVPQTKWPCLGFVGQPVIQSRNSHSTGWVSAGQVLFVCFFFGGSRRAVQYVSSAVQLMGLSEQALSLYLDRILGPFAGQPQLSQFTHGESNPTYLVQYGMYLVRGEFNLDTTNHFSLTRDTHLGRQY